MMITPKLVEQNRNTSAAAPASAGSRGSVTVTNARTGLAPNVGRLTRTIIKTCHAAATTRTTTATLRNTCAARIGYSPDVTFKKLSGPSNTARKATPTTTVGNTNGTVTTTNRTRDPAKSTRATSQMIGAATTIVSSVDAAACPSVKPSNPQACVRSSDSPSDPPAASCRARLTRATSGHRKKTPRNTVGTTARAPRRSATATGPSPSATARATVRDCRRYKRAAC